MEQTLETFVEEEFDTIIDRFEKEEFEEID